MLHLLDESIESFLRASVPLGAREIDVSFEAPDKEWSAQLNRPTVNLFLWDIARSTIRAEAGFERRMVNGVYAEQRVPIPVEFRYLVTAWTADHTDEHQLLGALLRTLIGAPTLPAAFLAGELAELPEPTVVTPSTRDRVQTDLWKALDGQLKPGIEITLTVDVPAGPAIPLAPATEDVGVDVGNLREADRPTERIRRVAGEVAVDGAAGVLVRGPHGSSRVNPAGGFLIRAATGDEIVVETDPPRVAVVPDSGGLRFT